jgi:hypothetical protein
MRTCIKRLHFHMAQHPKNLFDHLLKYLLWMISALWCISFIHSITCDWGWIEFHPLWIDTSTLAHYQIKTWIFTIHCVSPSTWHNEIFSLIWKVQSLSWNNLEVLYKLAFLSWRIVDHDWICKAWSSNTKCIFSKCLNICLFVSLSIQIPKPNLLSSTHEIQSTS